jgi:hypothetical protein
LLFYSLYLPYESLSPPPSKKLRSLVIFSQEKFLSKEIPIIQKPSLYRVGVLIEQADLFYARLRKRYCTIDECAAKIQSSIIKAYEKSCSLKTTSGVQITPYWSSEIYVRRQ